MSEYSNSPVVTPLYALANAPFHVNPTIAQSGAIRLGVQPICTIITWIAALLRVLSHADNRVAR